MRDATLHSADRGIEQGAGPGRAARGLRAIRKTGCANVSPVPGRSIRCCATSWSNCCGSCLRPRAAALDLADRFQGVAVLAQRYFDDMDFGFLFDENRGLLRIGYNVDAEKGDQSYYDLLASEARTAVFLAIAKGDIPRETWLRLGRKLTAYRDQVTLLAWSGTMFEYLMPQLHLRSYAGTLLDRSLRAAVRIQRSVWTGARRSVGNLGGRARRARCSGDNINTMRSECRPLAASGEEADTAGDRALRQHAGSNDRSGARHAELACHGCERLVDAPRILRVHRLFACRRQGAPEVVHCFMAHHQGMALLAIDNALLGNRMQERFHHDPLVQSTEFLLEERMPVLVDVTPMPAFETAEA